MTLPRSNLPPELQGLPPEFDDRPARPALRHIINGAVVICIGVFVWMICSVLGIATSAPGRQDVQREFESLIARRAEALGPGGRVLSLEVTGPFRRTAARFATAYFSGVAVIECKSDTPGRKTDLHYELRYEYREGSWSCVGESGGGEDVRSGVGEGPTPPPR